MCWVKVLRLKRWGIVVLLFVALSVFTVMGQQIPQLGSASDRVWSKTDELSIGKAAHDRLRRDGHLYESMADLDYLGYLGNKIAGYAQTRQGLTFYITRSTRVNAFASPGGYVGVNVGLVLVTDNEHELAGVLAHEIAHVSQEHIARSLLATKDRRLANAAAMVAGVLMASQADGQLGAASITAVVAGEVQNQIDDIRRHEIEADRVGRRLMEAAGYNELGMQTFFGKLYTPGELDSTPSYLLTHPLPQRRQAAIDTLKARSKKLKSRDEYYLFRARVRSAFLSKKVVERLIAESQQDNNRQVHQAGIYLSALQAMKFGQIDFALTELSRLQSPMRDNRDIQLMRAVLLLLKGDSQAAQSIYQTLWQRYEGDSVVAYEYGQFLNARGEFELAADILSQSLGGVASPQLSWLYGEVLGRLGRIAEQHRALIDYHRNSGEYEQALAQAKLAVKQSALSWQQRAAFEAQVKELQHIIKRIKDH